MYKVNISLQKTANLQRESTTREVKGRGRHFFTQIEPNWRRAGTTVGGCQAGGLGPLLQYMCEYNAGSQKQGRKRFNSIVKTISFSYLPIIYLWPIYKDFRFRHGQSHLAKTTIQKGSKEITSKVKRFGKRWHVIS